MVGYGYVDKGVLGANITELACQNISGNGWNFFKLSVDANGDVDAYINDGLMGKFQSYFTPRGIGGVVVANGFDNVAEFRDFDLSPRLQHRGTNPLPPRSPGKIDK